MKTNFWMDKYHSTLKQCYNLLEETADLKAENARLKKELEEVTRQRDCWKRDYGTRLTEIEDLKEKLRKADLMETGLRRDIESYEKEGANLKAEIEKLRTEVESWKETARNYCEGEAFWRKMAKANADPDKSTQFFVDELRRVDDRMDKLAGSRHWSNIDELQEKLDELSESHADLTAKVGVLQTAHNDTDGVTRRLWRWVTRINERLDKIEDSPS